MNKEDFRFELADYFIHTQSRNMRIVLNMTSMERLSAIYSKDELDRLIEMLRSLK